MNNPEITSLFCGVRNKEKIVWLNPPNEAVLKAAIKKQLHLARLHRIPLWPAVSQTTLEGGLWVATRMNVDFAIFLWFNPSESIRPSAFPALITLVQLWSKTLDPTFNRGRIAFDIALELANLVLKMDDFEATLLEITRRATLLLQAERCSLFLVNETGSALDTYMCVRRTQGDQVTKDPWIHLSVPKGRGIIWRSIREGHPLSVSDVYAHPDFYAEADAQTGYNTRNLLCIPLFYEPDRVVGALEVLNKIQGPFLPDNIELATIFAAMAAPIVRLAQTYQELKRSRTQLEMVNRLLEAQLHANSAEIEKLRVQLECQAETRKRTTHYYRLVGQSKPMLKVYEMIEHLKDTDLPVLIAGASGTGKELVARSIHEASKRRNARFIAVNCAAIPETLMERELFGAERGAYTGANQTQRGLFEAAEMGTLFLDEISEMPVSMQAKLLRILDNKELRRIGSTRTLRVDVRIIAATNRKLEQVIEMGRFRKDLYYRLDVFRIDLVPLKDRKSDIPLLIDYFLRELVDELNLPEIYIDPKVINMLMAYSWPGNVRQLENEIRRMATLGHGRIVADLVPIDILQSSRPSPPRRTANLHSIPLLEESDFPISHIEEQAIIQALKFTNGNKARAAKILGISRRTLYDKISRYAIEPIKPGEPS